MSLLSKEYFLTIEIYAFKFLFARIDFNSFVKKLYSTLHYVPPVV